MTKKVDLKEIRTVHDAKQELTEIDQQMEAIRQKADSADRNMTTAERKEFDSLMENMRAVNDHLQYLEADKERRLILAAQKGEQQRGEAQPKQSKSGWYDLKTGDTVPVIEKEDRARDIFASEQEKNLSLGRGLRAFITDDWNQAKEERSFFTTASAGGMLVPRGVFADVIDYARKKSTAFRAGAKTIGLSQSKMGMAKITSDPTVELKAEGEAFNWQGPGLDAITFEPKTVGCIVRISRELARDGNNVAEMLEMAMANAIATFVDDLVYNGDGTGLQPTGLFHKSGVNEIDLDGLAPHYGHLIRGWNQIAGNNAQPNALVMHPVDMAFLASIYSSTHGWVDKPDILKDLKWMHTTQMPSGGGVGEDRTSMIMGDFSKVFIGIREDIRIETTTIGGGMFESHGLGIKLTMSMDVQVAREADFCRIIGAKAPADFWDIDFSNGEEE